MSPHTSSSRSRIVAAVVGATSLVLLGLASPSIAETYSTGPARPVGPTWTAAGPAIPSHSVRLVTGEVLRISEQPGSMPSVAFVDPARSRTYFRLVDSSGDLHVVPSTALPHLGAGLDPALYDASTLIRHGYGTSESATTPVTVSFTAGPVTVPGVTVTGRLPNGEAIGFVDADGASQLGDALAALDGHGFLPGVGELRLRGSAPAAADAPDGPLSTLHLQALPPKGGDDMEGAFVVMGIDTGASDLYPVDPGALEIEVEVPDGPYAIFFYGDRMPAAGEFEIYGVGLPEVSVDGPTTLVLDTGSTVEATYSLSDGATPSDDDVEVSSVRTSDALSSGINFGALFFEDVRVFLAPTDPVTMGTFDQVISWAGADDGRFYTLPVVLHDQIPDDLAFELGPDELATITNHYARDVDGQYWVGRLAITVAGAGTMINPNDAPGERVDVVTVRDVITAGTVLLDAAGWIGMDRVAVAPVGGSAVDEYWLNRPIRPAVPDGLKGGVPIRVGDDLYVTALTFVDPGFAFGGADPGVEEPSIDTVTSELRTGGKVIWTGTELQGQPMTVGPDPATYELSLDVARDADWWLTSTQVHTTWTFDSEHSDRGTPLDFLQVDYDVTLDGYNHADAPVEIAFRPYNLTTPDGSTIADLAAQWSTDDGDTWTDVSDLSAQDGWWTGHIGGDVCNDSCTLPVTLRVTATDVSGATIEQTIQRAFTATFNAPTETPTTTPPTTTPPPTTTEPPTTTVPPTTTTEPTGTTTLPGTGTDGTGPLAGLGGLALLAGAVAVVIANRRLRSAG